MKRLFPILLVATFMLCACSEGNGAQSASSASSSDDSATQASSATDPVTKEKTDAETATTEDDTDFEETCLEKIQGIWTSWGHTNSESWIIEGRTIHFYMAIWAEDMSGPTDEYEFRGSSDIESVEKYTGKHEGEFIIHLKDSDWYYIYIEREDSINLECHLDDDFYSGTDSMFKDDSKSVDMFPPAVSSEEVTEVIPSRISLTNRKTNRGMPI